MDGLLDEVVSSEDLKKFEEVYNRQVESGGNVTTEATFNYGWCLIKSRYAADIRKGIVLLETLFREGDGDRKRDCVYYLAIGHAKIREYKTALKYIRSFMDIEPGNQQVQMLETEVKKRMDKEGLVGIALASGAAIAVGGALALGMALVRGGSSK